MSVVYIGAGPPPHPEEIVTVDVRTDIEVDHPGINIGTDIWPFDDGSVERIIGEHVLEHIPPNQLDHVFQEMDRVLAPGGSVLLEMPHSGSLSHATNPTHYGNGTTSAVVKKFRGNDRWSHYDWEVSAEAVISWPTFLGPSRRVSVTSRRADIGLVLCRLPFADGVVNIEIKKSKQE